MTVSMVRRCHDTETQPISFDEIWDATRHGKHGLKGKITQIRNRYEVERELTNDTSKAKKAVAELKMELPGFMPSGSFSERNNAALMQHSGILCADLDSLGSALPMVRQFFQECEYVRAVALSPSGDGLKVFFAVEPNAERHGDSFRAIRQYVLDRIGFDIDEKCKDPARICFFTYDPELWIRDEVQVIPPADPLPRARTVSDPPPSLTAREQIAFSLLGELRHDPAKGGYFVRCPGESFHSNKTAEKHTILYLESVPTLSCQHQSCAHAVDAFNKVLRSEIGKAEFIPGVKKIEASSAHSVNGSEPEEDWVDILSKGRVTSTELSGLTITPRAKILGDWFCEGDLGFFFGPRGAGKTWHTLGFTQAITTAGTLGDWTAPNSHKVLYIDGEMPADSLQARCQGLRAINDNLLIINHSILFDRTNRVMHVTDPRKQKALTDCCINWGVGVLILDNLSTLGVGMKENDADSWELVNAWLLDLRRRGIAVVIIHHSGRSGQMRGTSRREDNVFWIVSIDDIKKDSEERGAKFTTRFTKASRNTPNEIPDYEWHYIPDNHTGLITIEHKIAHSLSVFRAVIESGVTKPSEIAKVMRVEDYQVSRMAHKAIGQGWLERVNRGEYALIEGK